MKEENQAAEKFLDMKLKAAKQIPWTSEEFSYLEVCLKTQGPLSLLAACCAISSHVTMELDRSINIIVEAVTSRSVAPYPESCIYEALLNVEPQFLIRISGALLPFVETSLEERRIDMTNTVCLIGKMAKTGHGRAMKLLRDLADSDSDADVRENAAHILNVLKE